MTRQDLIKELQDVSKNKRFIKRPGVCECFGVSRNTAKMLLAGVEPIAGNLYYIPDVADYIISDSIELGEEASDEQKNDFSGCDSQ